MTGFIQTGAALPRLATAAASPPVRAEAAPFIASGGGRALVGVVSNRRSHRNRQGRAPSVPNGDVMAAAPETKAELAAALLRFRRAGVELLVVDGGDGTVRDVLSAGAAIWCDRWPRMAVVPSGKTNALAIDLGVPDDWTVEAAAAASSVAWRSPLEIRREDEPEETLRGFLFGAGAFVGATDLAQHTHRAGAFRGLAVGLALGGAIAQTLFGGDEGRWRAGTPMRLGFPADARSFPPGRPVPGGDGARYLLLAGALTRLPVGLKPFGRPRDGLKTLVVDAPPRRLALAVPAILWGAAPAWLARAGYHRVDARTLSLDLPSGFILDGELFSGGRLTLREARPLAFAVP